MTTPEQINLRELVRIKCRGKTPTIAKALNIRTATIYNYVNGKQSMSADTVERILNLKL